MLSRTLLAISALVALPAMAQWQVAPDESSLNFLTTKNAQITEVHAFEKVSGTINNSNMAEIDVALDSVNTKIELRDTRMKDILFETGTYPKATFSANITKELLNLPAGSSKQASVKGTISLHGMKAPTTFDVLVTKVNDNTLTVTTVAPTVLSAANFGLNGGVQTLQTLAGLSSITTSVPVTFSVTFTQK